MSSKLDCLHTLQQLLFHRFNTTVGSGTDLATTQTFYNLAMTASNDSFSDGLYAQIKPFFEPLLTWTFLFKVKELNDSVENGRVTPANFAAYAMLLHSALLDG